MSLLREPHGRASGIPRCARDDKEVLLATLRVSTVVIKQLLRFTYRLKHRERPLWRMPRLFKVG